MSTQLLEFLASLSPASKIALGAVGTALLPLLGGKFIRRLVLLPFKKIAEKTQNKEDDVLLHDAEQDLGLEEEKK